MKIYHNFKKITSLCLFLSLMSFQNSFSLAPLPGSNNPIVKQEISALLDRNLARLPETEDEVNLLRSNNTSCILLSSGEILVSESLYKEDIPLLGEIAREQIKAIMQILLWERNNGTSSKFSAIKELVTNLAPRAVSSEQISDIYVIDSVSRAFQWLLLLEDKIITINDVPLYIRPFVLAIGEIAHDNRTNYFTKEFWNPQTRMDRIKDAINHGATFYDIDLFPKQIDHTKLYELIERLKAYSYLKVPRTTPSEENLKKINELKAQLISWGPSITPSLIEALKKLFIEVDNEKIKNFTYKYARKTVIEVITNFDQQSMFELMLFFKWLEQNISYYKYYDYIIEDIRNSNSEYISYFAPFCIDYLRNHDHRDGVIFRTNHRVDPTIALLDKCGDPRGFLWKLHICADSHKDTDNTAVFVIKLNDDGSLTTATFPGLVKHQGGIVENYRGSDLLANLSNTCFRGTLHGTTKKTTSSLSNADKVFLRLDPPNGTLHENEVEDMIKILKILSLEIHPDMPLVIFDQTIEQIEKHFHIHLSNLENLTLSKLLFSVENAPKKEHREQRQKKLNIKISPLLTVEGDKAYARFAVKARGGLHMKQAISIATLMQHFPKTNAILIKNGTRSDTRNVLDLQFLGAGYDEIIELEAEGPRAQEVATVIINVINEGEINKERFIKKYDKFPTSRKKLLSMKRFIEEHPEILDSEILTTIADLLRRRLAFEKWPWRRKKILKTRAFVLSIQRRFGMITIDDVQRSAEAPSNLLQFFLDLHTNPFFKATKADWQRIVKPLILNFLDSNILISTEKMAVFGICMDPDTGTPIKFSSKPSRFYTYSSKYPSKFTARDTLCDGFIEEAPDIIRGTISQAINSSKGFVRLDACSYENTLFVVTQVQKTVDFLIELGVNKNKELVFPEKTRAIINKMLGIILPEEFTLGKFKTITETANYIPEVKYPKDKSFSKVFGLPIRQSITINIPRGIHAKTAIHIVEITKFFPHAKLFIRKGNRVAQASDRVGLMRLGVGQGENVEILGVGPGAQTAIYTLMDFLKIGKTAKKEEIVKTLPLIFEKWTKKGVRLFKTLRETHDIKSTKLLTMDLLHTSMDKFVYTIKYDQSRLSDEQKRLLDSYIEFLKDKSPNPKNIRVQPFSGSRILDKKLKDLPLFSVYSTHSGKPLGEGHIYIDTEIGELNEYILRIPGLLNIAMVTATIPTEASNLDLKEKYAALMGFIKTQCILIIGEENFKDEILVNLRKIKLILPKIYRHIDSEAIDEYNRETRKILTMS